MKTYVLASKNLHKAQEIKSILGEGFEIITQTEAGVGDIEVIEDGKTFEENSAKKAITIMEATGKPCIADDSGLCVDYLDGAPSIYTARYAGENATDNDNIQKLLTNLKGVPAQERTAKFVCVIALAEPDKEVKFFRGECPGYITQEKHGESGFGYDPVFFSPKHNATFAEIDSDAKNEISHRAVALKLLKEYLG